MCCDDFVRVDRLELGSKIFAKLAGGNIGWWLERKFSAVKIDSILYLFL
jgi:hypothetical protein